MFRQKNVVIARLYTKTPSPYSGRLYTDASKDVATKELEKAIQTKGLPIRISRSNGKGPMAERDILQYCLPKQDIVGHVISDLTIVETDFGWEYRADVEILHLEFGELLKENKAQIQMRSVVTTPFWARSNISQVIGLFISPVNQETGSASWPPARH